MARNVTYAFSIETSRIHNRKQKYERRRQINFSLVMPLQPKPMVADRIVFSLLWDTLEQTKCLRSTVNKEWASQVVPLVKSLPAAGDTRDSDLNSGWGRSPGVGNGNPLQYSFLEKSLGQRSLAGYSPWGLKESDMTDQLTHNIHMYKILLFYSSFRGLRRLVC